MPARRQDSVTGGQKWILGEHEKFIYVNLRVWIKRKRWRRKKKIFSSKIFTNSGFHLKILRFSTNPKAKTKKKKGLRPQRFMKSGVSPEKLRKIVLARKF